MYINIYIYSRICMRVVLYHFIQYLALLLVLRNTRLDTAYAPPMDQLREHET